MIRTILALAAATTAVALPSPSAPTVTHATLDVPRDHGPQQVIVQTREFAPGVSSGWHVHPGTEIAYVVSGEMELQLDSRVLKLEPGDSFTAPRGTAHNGVNPGRIPAQVVITLVLDKGAAPRQAVPAPKRGQAPSR
jgi:quercetin dioxygenase-like cupin family protein